MKKKKLLFVYYKINRSGGINRVLTDLVNAISADYDVSILLLMSPHQPFYELNPDVRLEFVDTFNHWAFRKICLWLDKYFRWLPFQNKLKFYLYDFGAYQTLDEWMNAHGDEYDTIISCMYKLSAGLSINKKVNYKTIGWEHNNFRGGGLIWGTLRKSYSKKLKAVVAITSKAQDYFRSVGAHTTLIYNLMNEKVYTLPFKPFAEKKNQILFAANLHPEKNVLGFLKIIRQLDLPDGWIVKLIGDGVQMNLVRDFIKENHLEDKVQLLGKVSFDEVMQNMRESKIFCLTSENEPFGLVLIEAMFNSCVLLAYDCEHGPAEIINEKNGYLFPLHDEKSYVETLKNLISNPELIKKINISGYQDAQKWQKESGLKQWKEIL